MVGRLKKKKEEQEVIWGCGFSNLKLLLLVKGSFPFFFSQVFLLYSGSWWGFVSK